ncbi:uncharacterized protein LOC111605018 [Drosophila hydei]|uniref:Uncharacterized protein LOC111605018 n=1 Tax=Drosophila hydei TaxID=7224 RepID=A0A6J1MQ26_DROHY|nr:uncharacterized protein LOC111605018 [Drosophila hydei]
MWFELESRGAFLFLILFARQASALKYLFVPEDDDFFADCPKSSSNVLNVHGMADMSKLTLARNNGKISISGNSTMIWNIKPGDRIEMVGKLYQFVRGKWLQTPFSMTVPDSCPLLYDKPQYWYKYWTRHIINAEDIKDKCFYPGTKLIHEPFDVNVVMQFTGLPLSGRYKIVTTFKAFDQKNVQRDTSICIEVFGEFERIN